MTVDVSNEFQPLAVTDSLDLEQVSTAVSSIVADANRALLASQPGLPDSTRHIALAIGLFENKYGRLPPWTYKDESGLERPSFNWGATTAASGKYILLHDPQTDQWLKFSVFNSAEDGFRYFYGIWSKPSVLQAAATGDTNAVAEAMFANHYFVGNKKRLPYPEQTIIDYAHNLAFFAQVAAKALGEQTNVRQTKFKAIGQSASGELSSSVGPTLTVIAAAAFLGLGIYFYRSDK